VQLQEVLFGTFVPPEGAKSRVHRIGFSSKFGYKPPPVRVYKRAEMLDSHKKIIAVLKKLGKPSTPAEVSVKTIWTRNRCSILLCEMFKSGKLKRTKIIVGNSRTYLYSIVSE
jgi:hypothetical protein